MRVAPNSAARPIGTERTRPPSRKCSPAISHGGQQAGDRTRGEDGVGYRSGGEPMGRRPFDRGGHAFEPHAEVGKVRALAEPLIEQSSQPIVGVEVRPVAGQAC